jgi:hypothetical protein
MFVPQPMLMIIAAMVPNAMPIKIAPRVFLAISAAVTARGEQNTRHGASSGPD